MTKMIPATPKPDSPASERRVFELIRDAEGMEDYFGLHSVGLPHHEKKNYSEADFVIVGPLGIFCLEVKGGEIHHENGAWTIGWPGSSYTSNQSPFEQSETTRWPIINGLSAIMNFNLRNQTIVGWGVVFPDAVFNVTRSEWPAEVLYDQRNHDQPFLHFIERLEKYEQARNKETGRRQPQKLGRNRIEEIVGHIRGDFDAVTSLTGLIADSHRELVGLNSDQFRVLDFSLNEQNSKIICNGPAGAGKTLIAVEAAGRLASQGSNVLLVCFNQNLVDALAKDTRTHQGVTCSTVYRFIAEVIDRGGYRLERNSAHAVSTERELFLETYPKLFDDAAMGLLESDELPQYDVIIVDEGQDILNLPVMNCLDVVLKGGFRNGRWAIFMDKGLQSEVYGRMDEKVLDHLKAQSPAFFELNDNFRNPREIVIETCRLTQTTEPRCWRRMPSFVDYRTYSDEADQRKKLSASLSELKAAGVEANMITILSPYDRERSCLGGMQASTKHRIFYLGETKGDPPQDAFIATTMSAYKGLENEIIILTDVPVLSTISQWERSILYVGMTRAKTKLIVLIDESFLATREHLEHGITAKGT